MSEIDEAKRGHLLQDFLDFAAFAVEVDRCERTVDRWTKEPDGLLFTSMGNTKLIHIPTARQWLINRMRQPNPRRSAERAA